MGIDLSGSLKWHGIAEGPDGKLYCAPYNATDILVIDPASGTAQRTNMGVGLLGDNKWSSIAAGPDGRLYCAPYSATDILIIDPASGTAQRTNMDREPTSELQSRGNVVGPVRHL